MIALFLLSLFSTPLLAQSLEESTLQVLTPSQLGAAFYCGIMVLSALGYYFMRRAYGDSIPLFFYYIHTTIVLWSGMMYCHFIFDTPFAPFAYYMDWIVSTPLIVLALSLTAMIKSAEKSWANVYMIMVLQASIILTGLFAQILGQTAGGLAFFSIGNGAMVGVFYLIWGPFMRIAAASGSSLYSKYRLLGALVIIFWIAYPIIWMLGTPGMKVLSDFTTQVLFIVLPILCKAGFGFLDLYLVAKSARD